MSFLPKPKFCDQDWLQMLPNEKGRLCAACQKNIVDFSKMRWAAIEKLQGENGNSLCGMYSEKQLEYWGREVPAPPISRFARAAVFVLGLVGLQARAQSDLPADTLVQKLVIKGTVTGKSFEGNTDPLTGASIRITWNGKFIAGEVAGIDGDYNITVLEPVNELDSLSIEFSYLGFERINVTVKPGISGTIQCDAEFPPNPKAITYYVIKSRPIKPWKHWLKSIFNEKYRKH